MTNEQKIEKAFIEFDKLSFFYLNHYLSIENEKDDPLYIYFISTIGLDFMNNFNKKLNEYGFEISLISSQSNSNDATISISLLNQRGKQ